MAQTGVVGRRDERILVDLVVQAILKDGTICVGLHLFKFLGTFTSDMTKDLDVEEMVCYCVENLALKRAGRTFCLFLLDGDNPVMVFS